MQVFRGRAGGPSEKRSATFTGVVYGDAIMPMIPEKVSVGSVCFEPGARTYWHAHGQGQILQVTSGSGWVCKEGEAPQAIRAGDVVWIGAGERHWHGASGDSYMVHTATSLGGTHWQEEVPEEVYRKAVGPAGPKIL
jgi:quercetin dioxygenase-like cupin family protein